MGNCACGRAPLLGAGHYTSSTLNPDNIDNFKFSRMPLLRSRYAPLHDSLPHCAAVQHILGDAPDVAACPQVFLFIQVLGKCLFIVTTVAADSAIPLLLQPRLPRARRGGAEQGMGNVVMRAVGHSFL